MDLSYRDLDWRALLVKHYRYYGIDENGLAAVLCIADILSSFPSLVTADDLVSYMTISKEEIDHTLVMLVDKKIITYISQEGKTVTSLQPLMERIFSDLKKDIIIESKDETKGQVKKTVNSLYSYFEETLGRPMTGREVDRISFWIRSGADERMVKEAVEKLKAQNKSISLAAVDRIVLSIQKSDDISKEGFSSRKEDYREGSQETLDILSKPWVPK